MAVYSAWRKAKQLSIPFKKLVIQFIKLKDKRVEECNSRWMSSRGLQACKVVHSVIYSIRPRSTVANLVERTPTLLITVRKTFKVCCSHSHKDKFPQIYCHDLNLLASFHSSSKIQLHGDKTHSHYLKKQLGMFSRRLNTNCWKNITNRC